MGFVNLCHYRKVWICLLSCQFEVGTQGERLNSVQMPKHSVLVQKLKCIPSKDLHLSLPKACTFCAFIPDFWNRKKRERTLLLSFLTLLWFYSEEIQKAKDGFTGRMELKGWHNWCIQRTSIRGIILHSTGQHTLLSKSRVLFQNALGSTLQLHHETLNNYNILFLISKNPCDMYANSFKSEGSWESLLGRDYLQEISDTQQSFLYVHTTNTVTQLLFEKDQYKIITWHMPRFLDFLLLFASMEIRKLRASTE